MTRIGNRASAVNVKRDIVAGMTCMAVGVLSGQGSAYGQRGSYTKLPALADGGVKVTRLSVLQGSEQQEVSS